MVIRLEVEVVTLLHRLTRSTLNGLEQWVVGDVV